MTKIGLSLLAYSRFLGKDTVQQIKRIAYLAPEIPALSATFVYNEIIALQEEGFEVVSISVHTPGAPAAGDRVEALHKTTHYLYNTGLLHLAFSAIRQLIDTPREFSRTFRLLLQDLNTVRPDVRLCCGLIYRFCAACKVAQILRNKHCLHLHAHFAHVPTDIAMYAAAMAGISFSFTSHANDLFERRWLLTEKITRSKFSITISEFNRKFMIDQGGQPNKIYVIYCGVDIARFTPLQRPKRVPPFVIGSLGRMVEKKGFDLLLKAAYVLKNRGVDFRLIIAGDGPLKQKLQAIAKELNLLEEVEFSGPVTYEQVPDWLHSLDIFVLPCQQDSHGDMDGIPVVLMEAMSAGVSVISTNISGIPELIQHGHDGFLIDHKSIDSLVNGITILQFNPSIREQFAINGREKITNKFNNQQNISKLSHYFQQISSTSNNGTHIG